MKATTPPCPIRLIAANDNGEPPDARKIDEVVMRLARLIGQQMARQDAGPARAAANDNPPEVH